MTKERLLTPTEEMELLREVLAGEDDECGRAEIARRMIALNYREIGEFNE